MSSSPTSAEVLWREGALALKAGRAARALEFFRKMLEGGHDVPVVWLAVAVASRQAGDRAGMLEALDAVLARAPRDVRALMMKADHFTAMGDIVAAASFHRAVVRIADEPGLPPGLEGEVARARAADAASARQLEHTLLAGLEDAGIDRKEARRVRASIDMMLGRAPVLTQRPTQFYFPELPLIDVYEREDTPWLAPVEIAFNDIREELAAVLADDGAFSPYHEPTPARPMFDREGMIGDPGWSAYHLVKGGEPVSDHADRCPKTLAAVNETPLCRSPGRTPSILFSLLQPGARIPPHHGLLNTRLICHLPLIVPAGCGLRVGARTYAWTAGEAFAFDDSVEHEAWNQGSATRVVLIFDVWRPELSVLERELVSKILEIAASLDPHQLTSL